MNILQSLHKYKYEFLFIALIQHLFIGILLTDLEFYTKIIWPTNMVVLGIASIGVFIEKGKWKNRIKNILFLLVVLLPILVPFLGKNYIFMLFLNISYCFFYAFIFIEVLRFLIKPSYINKDILTAAFCGYLLLIEISTFLLQGFYYSIPNAFKGIDYPFSVSSSANVFMDLVYFSSVTITSIGFGDITPNIHYTKLITSIFGIIGQFYSVVLVGILISKFTSRTNNN